MSYCSRKPPVEVRVRRWKYIAVTVAVVWIVIAVFG